MKTSDLAKRLKVHPNTVRNYADEYARFLSAGAISVKRAFTQDDALIIATIAHLRNQGIKTELVKQQLEAGYRVDTLPTAATPEEETARESIALVALPEYSRVLDLLKERENELARVVAERDKAQTDSAGLNNRIADLQLEIGTMRGRLELLEKERPPAAYWLRLLAIAVLVTVVLTIATALLLAVALRSG